MFQLHLFSLPWHKGPFSHGVMAVAPADWQTLRWQRRLPTITELGYVWREHVALWVFGPEVEDQKMIVEGREQKCPL